MRQRLMLALSVMIACSAATIATVALASPDERERPDHKKGYEVWAIDQSDTVADGGGMLYVFDGPALTRRRARTPSPSGSTSAASPDSVRSLCLARTGTAPQRPHMLVFNGRATSARRARVCRLRPRR